MRRLHVLRDRHPNRDVQVRAGDFNQLIDEILTPERIPENEATFCLLDQRTFECHWETVRRIARHKQGEHKIEIFYFFANAWLERAYSSLKDPTQAARWWGRDDYATVPTVPRANRAAMIRERFRDELGYRYAASWPIYANDEGKLTMYYMVHATDHAEGKKFMLRAYRDCVKQPPPNVQLTLLEPE